MHMQMESFYYKFTATKHGCGYMYEYVQYTGCFEIRASSAQINQIRKGQNKSDLEQNLEIASC